MEFFENQVSEVSYLTNLTNPNTSTPPEATTVHHHQPPPHQQRQSTPAAGAGGAGTKRKSSADESSTTGMRPAPQQRSRRNRYISIACNECKRRKIKCNGETPCVRCGNLGLECLYAPNCCGGGGVKDSDEFKQMAQHVDQLQEQVDSLFRSMRALRSDTLHPTPLAVTPSDRDHDNDRDRDRGRDQRRDHRALSRPSASSTTSSSSIPPPPHRATDLPKILPPPFRGPTSLRFSLDIARNTLHRMGYDHPAGDGDGDGDDDGSGSGHGSPLASPDPATFQPGRSLQPAPDDVLWEMGKAEMIRLCRIFEEEIGIMFPIVDIEQVIRHATNLTAWMEAARRKGLGSQDFDLFDLDTMLLKIVLCQAMVVEEHGNSVRAQRIFAGLKPTADRMLMSDPANVKCMPLLCLVGGFYYLTAEDVLSWRILGQVARQCLELGLHQRAAVDRITDQEERRIALNTFWTAFALDRRWSLVTGLPYVIQDDEVDVHLPYPDSPFLVPMIHYSKLIARVWQLVRHFNPDAVTELQADDIDEMDRQIKKWYSQLPGELQLEMTDWEALPRFVTPNAPTQREYNHQRLQLWTYLRLNQLRTWLYTPVLHTHSSIMGHVEHAETVVRLAQNTIRYLTHIHNTTDVYRKAQVFYHQYLAAAITVLFLASCHAPVVFSARCRDEFYMGLELVRGMSARSWISKRLWHIIKSMRDVAPRLGLGLAADHRHHSIAPTTPASVVPPAAPASAGQVAAPAPPVSQGYQELSPAMDGSQGGVQMSSEMLRIFEGYRGQTAPARAAENLALPDTSAVSASPLSLPPAAPYGNGGGGGGGYRFRESL
ncbi:hypothetical protein GGR56DRAFT_413227 [Xylariaceae sp. FL0804]|nr:hypothetical protein GGR56DRAFT_413227 [Xylariaceae sp. FL0804]